MAKINRQGSTGMTPLQRAKSELLVVHEKFKARTTRRGRQNRNPQDQMPADGRDGADAVVQQANKTTLRDKIRRIFSPRRGKLTVQLISDFGGVTSIDVGLSPHACCPTLCTP